MPLAAIALASPVKRTFTASPTASPDLGRTPDRQLASPRVLRPKLSVDQVALECPLVAPRRDTRLDGERPVRRGTDTTPSTPPEVPLEPLVGLGVASKDDGAREAVPVVGGGDETLLCSRRAPTPQVLAAERQIRELEGMPQDVQITLAKLCSQHWLSQYNALKRSLVAAAGGPQAGLARPVVAPPPRAPPAYTLPSFTPPASGSTTSLPSTSSLAIPSRPTSRAPSPAPTNSAPPSTPISMPHRSSTPTSLTPSLANFGFNLSADAPTIAPPSSSAAPTAEATGLLASLVQGEPVAVQHCGASVVVSGPVPKVEDVSAVPKVPEMGGLPRPAPSSEEIPGLLPGMQVVNGVAVKTSASHPINISPLVPPELLEYLASNLSDPFLPPSRTPPLALDDDAPFILRPSVATDLISVTAAYYAAPSTLPVSDVAPPPLGNFVLSSCPGKKVRMNGEPKQGGRGAICRDVATDLRRARDDYNVRLVVCCLDDDELAYLGVPWNEYGAALDALEMDVVRLPMVEGFAPSGAEELDGVLSRIVQQYTLRGTSVLAHCRGGIGRAGLVASAWMLKMGLVAGPRDGEGDAALWEGEEPLRIVERVIELVRRRRSIKAIETPHQVSFLLDYVTYLQQGARIVTVDDLAAFLPLSPRPSPSTPHP
ncbi:hypothetical protein JCM3775_003527 [Rhodotorula graminis]|uniref:Tyrosine specific protein phosphatases domain-containing protein n=1 Tax=Rhodotorula graminis (strain WP1) TaxID=578459 RepID=A0A0P9GK34_RHOGW|nr:uncharacterized protein RHOBADRAFT_54767 [Rhodotorula graminis WP1]KPV73559.1 hypothetical protein RHOBADRAFT_54767 [Rhodotorula graminis WP1]